MMYNYCYQKLLSDKKFFLNEFFNPSIFCILAQNERLTRKHPKSAPPKIEKKLSILSKFQKNNKSFDDDHVMKSFRARTEMLLSKYEDIDEVSHDEFQSSSDDEAEPERDSIEKRKQKTGFVFILRGFPYFDQSQAEMAISQSSPGLLFLF